jgi:hypothetical protein
MTIQKQATAANPQEKAETINEEKPAFEPILTKYRWSGCLVFR